MKRWYPRIYRETDAAAQLGLVGQAIIYYQNAYEEARLVVAPPQGLISKKQSEMAGVVEQNYASFQDLEMIVSHLENMENVQLVKRTKLYLETYQRDLSTTLAQKYAEVHDDVQTIRQIRFQAADARNLYAGIAKGLASMDYNLSNLTKLRAVGLDDATF